MILGWLKSIVGEAGLPANISERADMVEFADAHHVLGQMAVAWTDKVDGKLKDVLENGLLRTGFDHRMLQFEMDRIERALAGSGIIPTLLKGGAYVATGATAGKGRRVSDLDILVSSEELAETERLLSAAGWAFDLGVNNDYDLLYYRKYMHELPPLRHGKRRTIVDVHHSLLPLTSRIKVRSDLMQTCAVQLEDRAFKVLTPIDLFIHSAIHTFADGSFDTPARSILELHYLLLDLSEADKGQLLHRAEDVGAGMPVATALWALADLFGDEDAARLLKASGAKPASKFVRYAIKNKLDHVETAKFAKLILFVRSHFLRMPLHLLVMHLGNKAIRKLRALTAKEGQPAS